MVRGLMVVLALVATAAHAQETKAAGQTDTAPTGREAPPLTVLASRSMLEPRSAPPTPSAVSPGAGTDAGTALRESTPALDAVIATYLEGGSPAVRAYQESVPGPQEAREHAWKQSPYVKSVTRCGRLYIFQVLSESMDAWAIDRARLEGPKGETLKVIAVHSSVTMPHGSINVIKAEAPPGVKVSKLKLHLTGRDGRVAQPEARDLP